MNSRNFNVIPIEYELNILNTCPVFYTPTE